MRTARVLATFFAGVLLSGAGTAAAVVALSPGSDAAVGALPAGGSSTTTTTTPAPESPVVPVAAEPLPVPALAPADPWARVPLVSIGEIVIPKIGVAQTIHEGVYQMVIDAGPAHWPGTAGPGGWGNVVIAGHRDSHGGPFHNLHLLVPGDEIVLRSAPGVDHVYRVSGSLVVQPTDMWIVDQHPGRTLTLFTCHPIGSSAQRLVITATLAA